MINNLEENVEKVHGRKEGRANYGWLFAGSLILSVSGLGYLFSPHDKLEHKVPYALTAMLGTYMIGDFLYKRYNEIIEERKKKNLD